MGGDKASTCFHGTQLGFYILGLLDVESPIKTCQCAYSRLLLRMFDLLHGPAKGAPGEIHLEFSVGDLCGV